MRVAIVHYHLKRGGVTRVIATALKALGPSVEQAVVLSSSEAEEPLPCPVAVIPELAYTRKASVDNAAALHRAMKRATAEHLGAEPDLWHIHNHSLGKNVNFPEAMRLLIADNQRLLLQIHDFSEDGRPDNFLAQSGPYRNGAFEDMDKSLYPCAPQIAYAVLNGRDRGILAGAGIPKDRIYWLPNAIHAHEDESTPPPKTSDKEPPLILYPTRGIRRKNLGELLLMAALSPENRYGTTLDPDNPDWIPVHEHWVSLARELSLPVEFAMSRRPGNSFMGLIESATSLVTTSVGEGFGLAFLEPWLFGRPVTGRNLPEITEDFLENGIELPDLYDDWPVPLASFDSGALRERFSSKLHEVYTAYQREVNPSEIARTWDWLTANEQIDFGLLDEIAQTEVLRYVSTHKHGGFALPVDPGHPDQSVMQTNAQRITDVYGLPSYRESLLAIYQRLLQAPLASPEPARGEAILDAFLDPRRLRLLRT